MCLPYIVICVCPLQAVVPLCTSLYSGIQRTVGQYLYFRPRMSWSKHKSSSDVAGTTVFFKVLCCKVKNVVFIFCVWFFRYYLCEKHYKPYNTVHALMLSCFHHVRLFTMLWTVALQAPLFIWFSRQNYWSGSPCPPAGDLPDPGIAPESLTSPALADRFFATSTP